MTDPTAHNLPYYHTHFTNIDQVCDTLTPYVNQDGAFLVRNSSRRQGTYTISVMHNKQVNHFNVEHKEGSGFYLFDKYFQTIGQLVTYYCTVDIPNKEKIGHIRLLRPVYSTQNARGRSQSIDTGEPEISNGMQQGNRPRLLPRQTSQQEGPVSEQVHVPRRANTERRRDSEPQLPLPPVKKQSTAAKLKQKIFKGSRTKSDSSMPDDGDDVSKIENKVEVKGKSSDPHTRPPMPLPECPYAAPSTLDKSYAASQEYTYVTARDEQIDMTQELIKQLRMAETESDKCHCGISIRDSELPQGWSVHRSQERETNGRLFFVSADNITSWTLPAEVMEELTDQQRQTLAYLRTASQGFYRTGPN